jgi:hypothetical protein
VRGEVEDHELLPVCGGGHDAVRGRLP